MNDLFDDLMRFSSGIDWIVFDDADIRSKANECIALDGDGLFAVRYDAERFHVSFCVFDFHSESSGEKRWNCIFRGCGPSGALRELRHTWWGEVGDPGYVFYLKAKVVRHAFEILERWFDMD